MCYFDMKQDREELFLNQLEQHLSRHSIGHDRCVYGVRFRTGLDSWIVTVKEDGKSDTPYFFLYHKNMFGSGTRTKGQRSPNRKLIGEVPEHHLQFRRQIPASQVVRYCINHGRKYSRLIVPDWNLA